MTQILIEEKVILDEEYAIVSYLSSTKFGKIIWKRKPDSEEYRCAFQTLLKYSQKQPVNIFLSDTSKQGIISPDDRKWFETEMLPAAVQSGLKKAAVVFDGNIFKKYYLNLIISATNKFGMPLKLFLTEEDALLWLEKEN